MHVLQVLLYIAGVILLVIAAFPISSRVSLALLGAACLALGFTLPVIAAAIH